MTTCKTAHKSASLLCVMFVQLNAAFMWLCAVRIFAHAYKGARALICINECLSSLGLAQHPDKTSIGQIDRGFDFSGYHHSPVDLCLAKLNLGKHQTQLNHRQLQAYPKGWMGQSNSADVQMHLHLHHKPRITSPQDVFARMQAYEKRFHRWAIGGLQTCKMDCELY